MAADRISATTEPRPGGYPAAFLRAVETVLADEGGYVDNRDDPGGETKFGISQRDYPSLEVRNLTRAGAIAIYYRDFWQRGGFAKLPDSVAVKLFDVTVNIGPKHAAEVLQRALRAVGASVVDDGKIGELTIIAAHAANPEALSASMRSEAAAYYRVLASEWAHRGRDASQFIKGWLNRAYR